MPKLNSEGRFYLDGALVAPNHPSVAAYSRADGRKKTIAGGIIAAHDRAEDDRQHRIVFDALCSHDITFVGIIQTARASGLERFDVPYVLTCCHNSLCATGGTINADDHAFGLSAAKKYGALFVPPHIGVIHSYMRENMAACGRMILGSDSHTRYGALGTMGVGEGGPELVKQLLHKTYDVAAPKIIAVYVTGKPAPGVGPQDVAIALVGATFENGFAKNNVLEFIGPGIASLPVEYRNGIDVMTTETTCLSSVWRTDERVKRYYELHKRPGDYKELNPANGAWYDAVIELDLSRIKPMIALPFHPSNAFALEDFIANSGDMLRKVEKDAQDLLGNKEADLTKKTSCGKVLVDQGVIAGCAGGTFDNIMRAASILSGKGGLDGFNLTVYPGSQSALLELAKNGAIANLAGAGAVVRTAFCGPCFGAGDVPNNGGLSIRHTTRNFPSREGAVPKERQIAYVALMDARSIATTALNGGVLTPATALDNLADETQDLLYAYDDSAYRARVYNGIGSPMPEEPLVFGPGITDWPAMKPLPETLVLRVVSAINDPVTTTDELIPSGETSSYRSNPLRLAEFALSRKDPGYVGRAKDVAAEEAKRAASDVATLAELSALTGLSADDVRAKCCVGSAIFAVMPGDGSAREQAASCQKVLGGWANLARRYATKRYRSNVVNWGMLPFIVEESYSPMIGDAIVVSGIRSALLSGNSPETATLVRDGKRSPAALSLPGLTAEEAEIILDGCLINSYAKE